MCNNRKYTPEEEAKIEIMTKCAATIVRGGTVKELEDELGMTNEEVMKIINAIGEINPPLHHDVMKRINGEI